jgi:hypothetical protein
MRAFSRVGLGALLAASLIAYGCFPDETAVVEIVGIEISSVPDEMFLGDVVTVTAILRDSSGAVIPGIAFRFSTDEPTALLVATDSVTYTSATIEAVGAGTPTVIAEVVGIEGVPAGEATVLIHLAVEIDSVTPASVAWGDTAFIWGVGLDEVSFVTIGGIGHAPIENGYTPEDPTKPQARGSVAAWVVPPAPVQSTVEVSSGSDAALFGGTLTVQQFDFLEPNDDEPRSVAVGFDTPLIAMEPRQTITLQVEDTILVGSDSLDTPPDTVIQLRDSTAQIGGVDWYTMPVPATTDMTVLLNSPFGTEFPTYVYFVDTSNFDIATPGGLHYCAGRPTYSPLFGFLPAAGLPRQFRLALQDAPVGGYEVFLDYGQLGLVEAIPYGYQVANSYVSELAPDAAEENDLCSMAAPYEQLSSSMFTIDNAGDPDWFSVTSPTPGKFQAYLLRHPVGVDLDLYAFDMNASVSEATLLGWPAWTGGGNDDLWAEFTGPDTYQFLIHDWTGIPTPYELVEIPMAPASAFTLSPASGQGTVVTGEPDTLLLVDRRTTRIQSTLQNGAGYDSYAFLLNAGDTVDIDFDGTMTALQAIFDQAGEDISVLEKAINPLFFGGTLPSCTWWERDVNGITPYAPFDCSTLDGFFLLYGPDGSLLSANDWDAVLAQVSSNFGPQRLSDPRIPLFVAPDSGVYTLKVYDYAGYSCDFFDFCGYVSNVNLLPQPFRFYMLEIRLAAAEVPPSTPVARPQAVALESFLRDPSLAQAAAPRTAISGAMLRQQYLNSLSADMRKKVESSQLMQAIPARVLERAGRAPRPQDPGR